ncbi:MULTISPECIES: hypothetical protein [Pectobacterium]|uniref:hypothetical protein n=1 Tax=Pectobacterium TaxID=122277 RepID=UPI000F8E2192|nr:MULTISPECIES: hypothetical protein [Pectobacterium]RUR94742.1 hypothetical protein PB16LOC_01039 [Pectobacterium versatile]GKV88174.1 hypothetical protein PEC301619_01560 [Pectobacterium carotovorum subsp. carotovorum]
MKFVSIQSQDLPDITSTIKECINLGQWILFKANTSDETVCFFLKTGKDIYALNERGRILTSMSIDSNPELKEMEEMYFFSDVKKPESLSNMHLVKC